MNELRNPVHVVKIPALYLEFDDVDDATNLINTVVKHAVDANLHPKQEVDVSYYLDWVVSDYGVDR